ncbi:MAG: AAA family ATPase [SAR202 cluster bacterium]|nr:AAA family ATPase [SAR202 cluster bacterium]
MWNTVTHDSIVENIGNSFQIGNTGHSYLISGETSVGKTTLAFDMARMFNCESNDKPCSSCTQCVRIDRNVHSDVRYLVPNSSTDFIGIKHVKELKSEVYLKPYEGKNRIVIIDQIHRLTKEASNSLLKILEEPPENVIFILLTNKFKSVLPTIVSRCRIFQLKTTSRDVISLHVTNNFSINDEMVKEISAISEGRLGWAIKASNDFQIVENLKKEIIEINDIFNSGIDEKFKYIDNLASEFSSDRNSLPMKLQLWIDFLRDLIFYKSGFKERLKFSIMQKDYQIIGSQISYSEIVKLIVNLDSITQYFDNNINPKLLLERFVLDLPEIRKSFNGI